MAYPHDMSIFLSVVLLVIGLVVPFVLVALIVLLVVLAVRRQSGRSRRAYRVHQRSRGSHTTMPFFYGDFGSGGNDSDWARDSGTWSNDSSGSGCGGDSGGSSWSSDSGGSSWSSDSGTGSSTSC